MQRSRVVAISSESPTNGHFLGPPCFQHTLVFHMQVHFLMILSPAPRDRIEISVISEVYDRFELRANGVHNCRVLHHQCIATSSAGKVVYWIHNFLVNFHCFINASVCLPVCAPYILMHACWCQCNVRYWPPGGPETRSDFCITEYPCATLLGKGLFPIMVEPVGPCCCLQLDSLKLQPVKNMRGLVCHFAGTTETSKTILYCHWMPITHSAPRVAGLIFLQFFCM